MRDDPDAWLDAFGPDDLDDPELAQLDAALERLAPRRAQGPHPAWLIGVGVVAGAGAVGVGLAAAGLLALLWSGADPAQPGGVALDRPGTPPLVAPARPESIPDAAPERPDPRIAAPEPPPQALEPPRAAPQTPPAAPGPSSGPRSAPAIAHHAAPTAPAPLPAGGPPVDTPGATAIANAQLRSSAADTRSGAPLRPGLIPAPDAEVIVRGRAAILRQGLLAYVHDAEHDPGVSRIGFEDLPVELVPVGTAFAVTAREGVGAVRVQEGTVHLVHTDGTRLAQLEAGQEALTVVDLDAPLGIRVIQTTGLPLGSFDLQLPPDCLCRPRDVVAATAAVRLAAREPLGAP